MTSKNGKGWGGAELKRFSGGIGGAAALALAAALMFSVTGCNKPADNTAQNQAAPADQQAGQTAADPNATPQNPEADANLAPVPAGYADNNAPAGASNAPAPANNEPQRRSDSRPANDDRSYANDRPPADDRGYSNDRPQGGDYYADSGSSGNGGDYGDYDDEDSNYGEPVVYAQQPPPPLPEYSQPEIPGDGYLWTPGYWSYASQGYYWVPGAWTRPPQAGYLWTPPYWGYSGGRYRQHNGYWGTHIGYYGGIDYGNGYTGAGYQGGYWRGDRFNYNRAVNNVTTTNVTNVYNRTVTNTTINNVTINNTTSRASYAGPGGVTRRPLPAELAATREQRIPPMTTQVQVRQQAAQNRAQFAAVNKGKPAVLVAKQPIPQGKPIAAIIPARPAPAPRPGRAAKCATEQAWSASDSTWRTGSATSAEPAKRAAKYSATECGARRETCAGSGTACGEASSCAATKQAGRKTSGQTSSSAATEPSS